MCNGSRRKNVLFLISVLFVALPVRAVSTYTCSTFTEDGGGNFPGVFPTSINNQGHIAGSFYPSSPFGTVPFYVDASGMNLPFTAPPFATAENYAISSVNNAGQVAGTALDSTISPPLYRGFISNPDGTFVVIYPPANTPDRHYSDVFVSSINDQGDTSGVVSATDASNVTTGYRFIRDSAGFFTLFDASPYVPSLPTGIDPLFQPKLNNSRFVLLGYPFPSVLRSPDGSETTLVYRIGARYSASGSDNTGATFYGINNAGLIVGDAFAPFVMGPNGNAPAVVCPEYRDSLNFARAYAINDNGVVTGNIQFSGTVFVATPTGFQSGLKLSNTSWGFSPNPVGVQGGSGTIYVSSTGTADLTFVSISVGARDGNDSPGDFTIAGTTCMPQQYSASTLAPGQFCSISFTFSPTGAGARTAQIQIEDDAPDSPHIIRISGTGLGKGRLQFSNDYWQFSQQPVGQTSGPGIVYIYNPGTDAINFSSIAISGVNSSDFAIDANSCAAAIAPYTTCAVSFRFTPQAVGPRNATLVFNNDSGTGRQVIPLTGSGF
jgi:hypothetical protein